MSKEVALINSDKKAIVDSDDYEWVSKFTWNLCKNGYAFRWVNVLTKSVIYMHDEVWHKHNNRETPIRKLGFYK